MGPNNALAITIISAISGSLSILGSTAIIYNVLHRNVKTRLSTTYNRIMFIMSIMDIISSGSSAFSNLPAPSDTPDVYAIGNTATCVTQGFLTTIGFSVIFYNFFLTVHYLLVICYKIDKRTMRQKVEPLYHFISLGYPLVTSVTGLLLDVYNFTGNGCWATPYPTGCIENDEIECTRGKHAYAFQWISIGFFMAFAMVAIPSISIFIIRHVWVQEYDFWKKHGHTSTNEVNDSNRVSCCCFLRTPVSRPRDEFISQVRVFTRTRAVAIQCSLYMSAFVMTYIWNFMHGIVEQATGQPSGTLEVLGAIFWPLQGFFNYLVFIQRHVIRLRAKHPQYSLLQAFSEATFHPARCYHLTNELRATRLSTIHQEKKSNPIPIEVDVGVMRNNEYNDIENRSQQKKIHFCEVNHLENSSIIEEPLCKPSENQDVTLDGDAEDQECQMQSYCRSNKQDGCQVHNGKYEVVDDLDVTRDTDSVKDKEKCNVVSTKSQKIEDLDITYTLDDHIEFIKEYEESEHQ